ncbi:MAG: putative sulfate exporter family transporter [Gemmatimonadetes bacterium]|nr:putative sulfate exporter family transporter [Gemmatimonadota bacterium]
MRRRWPGVAAAGGVALVAWGVSQLAAPRVSWAPDAVVLALLFGMIVHAVRPLPASWEAGVAFMGRQVLEVAIVVLGLTTDLRRFAAAGPLLVACTVGTTVVALGAGILIGRWCGLGRRHAVLVASGNAICGNTAIVAVARASGATAMETASAIASTALLSIGLVLALPVIGTVMALDDARYGALAGMTVYAMPQVLAATFPVSGAAGEVGTMVKLVRVMLMVPWLVWLGRHSAGDAAHGTGVGAALRKVLPWYLVLFLAGAALRTAGVIPTTVAHGAQVVAHALTVAAMAGVGLAVSPDSIRTAGVRTTLAALASMSLLLVVALAVVRFLLPG